ncbi:MAG: twin-arginine translocase subunit TatB [Rhizobiaceae bacterium]|nr:Sec-independent protein translocase protein TatB [Hyphomicrobiales bacterium]NRB31782.1 twin-arginine translocase subunit TatB [Rhizobiaceae bacterium]
MFDIGWTEMLVVAVVAILFVGPKELPGMLRTFGRAVKKIRMLAGDFQRQFDDALKDAELDGVKDGINQVRNLDPTKQIKDKLNPLKSDLDSVKKSVEEKTDFNPEELFDESKAPDIDPPVEVDVEAALEKQRLADEAKAKLPPSSGKNAVPGFGGPPGEVSELTANPVKPEAKAKAKAAAKSAAKPASKSTSAKKPSAKSTAKAAAATATAKKPTEKAAAAKKPAAKKPAAKAAAKTSEKAPAKKPAVKAAATKKPATKAAAAKKPAAKAAAKPAAKKPTTAKASAPKRKPAKKASA